MPFKRSQGELILLPCYVSPEVCWVPNPADLLCSSTLSALVKEKKIYVRSRITARPLSVLAVVLSYLHDNVCDFCLLPFNESVCCFTWYCRPKWAVSVLEWLSERLLGRMSGTYWTWAWVIWVVHACVACVTGRVDCFGGVWPTDS